MGQLYEWLCTIFLAHNALKNVTPKNLSEFFAEEDSALFFKFAEEFGGEEGSSSERGK